MNKRQENISKITDITTELKSEIQDQQKALNIMLETKKTTSNIITDEAIQEHKEDLEINIEFLNTLEQVMNTLQRPIIKR